MWVGPRTSSHRDAWMCRLSLQRFEARPMIARVPRMYTCVQACRIRTCMNSVRRACIGTRARYTFARACVCVCVCVCI